jgi:hypothetical protein
MKEEQQRIAIAEACGWKWERLRTGELHGKPIGEQGPFRELPDYCNDLNAIHEAIETLSVGEKSTYIMQLMDTCCEHPIGCVPDWTRDRQSLVRLTQATASQCAEAFLKTIDKWEDTKGTLV